MLLINHYYYCYYYYYYCYYYCFSHCYCLILAGLRKGYVTCKEVSLLLVDKTMYNFHTYGFILFQYEVKYSVDVACFVTAMKPHEIQEKLGLTRIRDRNWYVQPSCATTGDGLFEGLSWLSSNNKS